MPVGRVYLLDAPERRRRQLMYTIDSVYLFQTDYGNEWPSEG